MNRLSQLVVLGFTLVSFYRPTANADGYLNSAYAKGSILGCAKGDCRNGYGDFYYPNGNRYIGYFRDGQPDGQGILYYANGNKYLGHWEQNWQQGQGRFVFHQGHEYLGQFYRNQFHGQGTMRYANGDVYEGDWKFNQPEGFGVYVFYSTGNYYEGEFRQGHFEGYGTMFYKDGSKFVGTWRENKKLTQGTFYDADGRVASPDYAVHGEVALQVESSEENKAPEMLRIEDDALYLPTMHRPAPAESATDRAVKVWAIVIGISNYQSVIPLRFADDDAYQYYAFLKSPEGGALPDSQIKVLVDENATRDNILTTMSNIYSQASANDVIVFYYSGHGLEGAFVPSNSDGVNSLLFHSDIRQILDECKARQKIIISDACHAGSLSKDNLKNNMLASRSVTSMLDVYYKAFQNCSPGMAFLMSSKDQEASLEDSGLRSGVFSYYLIRGLKGEADRDYDNLVTIQELFAYVKEKVRKYTAGAQTPVITGDYDLNMPAGVVRY